MKSKKGGFLGFTGIEITRFVGAAMSFIVLIIIFYGIMAIWGPKEKAEAASLALMEDLRAKLSRLEDGKSVISSGSLDKGMRLVGFNSDYFPKDPGKDIIRPSKCGSRSNSCICLCSDDRCNTALECKGFSGKRVNIVTPSETIHWMPVSTTVVSGGKWDGKKPVQENIDIIDYLNKNNPDPSSAGMLPELKNPDSNGIYVYNAPGATLLYYHYIDNSWQWSPDYIAATVFAEGESSFVGKFSLSGKNLLVELIGTN